MQVTKAPDQGSTDHILMVLGSSWPLPILHGKYFLWMCVLAFSV